ncbi:hypothetical protein [Bordetella sp. LUAb4]|uniref:hypothetical protein n=1 Tax=Bordetella sp. LUAb4 TaxID=2843195 RepID=UPI001E546E12|nr:hypothetical protein [Bordetella sp. LUAb4]
MHKDFDRDPSTNSVPLKWLRGASVAAAVAMALAAGVPASALAARGAAPEASDNDAGAASAAAAQPAARTTSAHGAPAATATPAAPAAQAPAGGARPAPAQAAAPAGDPFAAPVTVGPMNPYAPRPTLAPVQKTIIQNQAAYERLMNNSGITVQWLWHADRGHLQATDTDDVVRLEGTQSNYEGTLKMKGEVVAISTDRFRFRGTILIVDAPDKGRNCERTGDFDFRISGKRKYWRLQQMEFCGTLTDYVDVYF